MNKKTFLKRLKRSLRGCSSEEIQSRLAFYAEMIDDRVEEGLSEEDAVSQIGQPEAIAGEILSETSSFTKQERRPMSAGAKVLIALGSPVWLSLLIAAGAVAIALTASMLAVVVSVFACMFAVLISLYAVLASVEVSALGGLVFAIACAFDGSFLLSLLWLGISFVCAGLSVVVGLVCVPVGKGILGAVVAVWRFVLKILFRRRVPA